MPQGIQGSSIGDQLRRAFGLRGLISTAVDEVLVPVGISRNLDTPPFRTDGLRWGIGSTAAASAGNFTSIQVCCHPAIKAVVDQIIVANNGAAACGFRIGGLQHPYLTPDAITLEGPTAIGTNYGASNTPIDISALNSATLHTSTIARLFLLPQTTLVIPVDLLLGPFDVASNASGAVYVQAETVNTGLMVSFSGRYWQEPVG